MYCHEETALKLAAFALQAEKGNYDALEKRHSYFRSEDYLPEKVRREGKWSMLIVLVKEMCLARCHVPHMAASLDTTLNHASLKHIYICTV